jgi:uncharacterized glyoxalase superfamily protein PhnB
MTPTPNALGLVVADMDRAVEFYRRLGIEFSGDTDHREYELAGGLRLMLDSEESVQGFTTGWVAPSGSPRAALAFECATPAEVDSAYADLIAAGAGSVREPWDAFWGQRYASVTDPDGNGVDLYAARKEG